MCNLNCKHSLLTVIATVKSLVDPVFGEDYICVIEIYLLASVAKGTCVFVISTYNCPGIGQLYEVSTCDLSPCLFQVPPPNIITLGLGFCDGLMGRRGICIQAIEGKCFSFGTGQGFPL